MELYLKLFEVLFPVFFVVGIGYYLGKNNPKIDTTFITNFAANIGTPAMIRYALTSTGTSFEIFRDYFWYFLIAIVAFTIIGIIFLFFLKEKTLKRVKAIPKDINIKKIVAYISRKVVFSTKTGSSILKYKKITEIIIA